MTRYEYMPVSFTDKQFKNKGVLNVDALAVELSGLGRDGWEIAGIVDRGISETPHFVVIFKRPSEG